MEYPNPKNASIKFAKIPNVKFRFIQTCKMSPAVFSYVKSIYWVGQDNQGVTKSQIYKESFSKLMTVCFIHLSTQVDVHQIHTDAPKADKTSTSATPSSHKLMFKEDSDSSGHDTTQQGRAGQPCLFDQDHIFLPTIVVSCATFPLLCLLVMTSIHSWQIIFY